MINLQKYEEYLTVIANKLDITGGIVGVMVNNDLSKMIQNRNNDVFLMYVIPSGQTNGENIDMVNDNSLCVVAILKKYDPQRTNSLAITKELQIYVEKMKENMIFDKSRTEVMRNLDLNSLSTMPEGGLYGNIAGWSLGFTL